MSEQELGDILKKFYANIRKKTGELYTPSALVCIRAAIHRTVTSPPCSRSINILQGSDFIAANLIVTAKCKVYTARGNPKPKHKKHITDADMEKLGEYFEDYNLSPRKLVEFVWFGICYYFGRRGREGHRELKAASHELKIDEEGHEYLTEGKTLLTKNHQGGPRAADNDYSDPRVYDKTFLEAYKLYMEKRCSEQQAFFQTPNPDWSPTDKVWFKNEPMGKNKLASIMGDLSKNAKLSSIYTPHSVRASMISILFKAGVQPKQICELTKHKNEKSLNVYIKTSSSAQKRSCCSVLSNALPIKVRVFLRLKKMLIFYYFRK